MLLAICFDKVTEEHNRFSFARVCVEVGVDDPLQSSIPVQVSGFELEVRVEYS